MKLMTLLPTVGMAMALAASPVAAPQVAPQQVAISVGTSAAGGPSITTSWPHNGTIVSLVVWRAPGEGASDHQNRAARLKAQSMRAFP